MKTFEWTVSGFEKTEIMMKLLFDNMMAVHPSDRLNVDMVDTSLFIVAATGKPYDIGGY